MRFELVRELLGDFVVHGVRDKDVVNVLLDQVLHVAVGYLDWEAGLCDGKLFAVSDNAAVGGSGGDDIKAQLLEVSSPEGEAIEVEHRLWNADGRPALSVNFGGA